MDVDSIKIIKKNLSLRHDYEKCKCDMCMLEKFKRSPSPVNSQSPSPSSTPPPPSTKYRRLSEIYKS